jgi:truncated hemoglobin YjbI
MPHFQPQHGFVTEKGRRDWLASKQLSDKDASASLVADPDPAAPLYHWQLFSLLGHGKIEAIVRAFYTRIYADTEAGSLRDAFARISGLEHHVATQAAFWADAFGGGRQYHGGDFRINFHHTHNAAHVMNAAGAKRWMLHMARTLSDDVDWSREDPRVKPCLVEARRELNPIAV